jgi:hypothetical protein
VFFLTPQNSLDIGQLQTDDNAVSSVCELARLDDPCVMTMQGILDGFILPGKGIVMLQELEVFIILYTIFDVESERQVVEDPFSPT